MPLPMKSLIRNSLKVLTYSDRSSTRRSTSCNQDARENTPLLSSNSTSQNSRSFWERIIPAKSFRSERFRSKMEGPDGGWAWCVAFAACLINFIMAGLGRMSGILYVAFIDLFHVDRKGAAAPFSVRSSVRNLLGPVVGILGQKYGVRTVTIIGGVIGSLSSALCFYTNDITWITVIWGGINGLGTALTTTLPQVVIGQYFKRHRTTASGMAFSGGCVGAFMFPALIEMLLQNYGLSGTFLVMGGIIMHVIPAAMILRKPPWIKAEKAAAVAEKAVEDKKQAGDEEAIVDDVFEPRKTLKSIHRSVLISEVDEKFYSTPQKDIPFRKSIKSIRNADNVAPKNAVDVEFLRNNMDLVWKVILNVIQSINVDNLKMPDGKKLAAADDTKSALEPYKEKCPIANELEDFYQKVEKSAVKDEQEVFVSSIQSRSYLKSIDYDDVFVRNVKSPSNMGEVNQAVVLDSVKSVGDLDRKEEWGIYFILTLLRELRTKDNIDLKEGECNQKVIDELCKAYKQLNYSENSDVFDNDSPLEKKAPCSISQAETDSIKSDNPKSNDLPEKDGFVDLFKKAFMLYHKPLFLLICLCRAVHFITFIPVVTVVVDFGMDKGLLAEDGKYIIAALSVGDLIGRLGLGWITDRGYVTLPKYMLAVMILQGASTASLPFMQSKAMLLPTIALFGLLQGSVFVRHPVLVSSYMGKNEQSIAMGCINFFSGFLGFGLPHYIGYFRDTLGSYDNMFYITGAVGTSIGLLWILEPYYLKCTEMMEGDDVSHSDDV